MKGFVCLAVIALCSVLLFGCGEDNPTKPMEPVNSPPRVIDINVGENEEIILRPITVKFDREMASVKIKVSGIEGTVVLNGDTAIWTPSPDAVSQAYPVHRGMTIEGLDKSGQRVIDFHFFKSVMNHLEAISKATIADMWFPGNAGSKWVYGGEGIYSASFVELNGKSYKAIISSSFPGEISKFPPYVFREENSRILGWADEDNKWEEAHLEDDARQSLNGWKLHDQLIAAGFTEDDIKNAQIKHESMAEWVVLEKQNLVPGKNWLVARNHVSIWIKGQKIADRIKATRAFVTKARIVKKFINQTSLDIPVVDIEYKTEDEDLQGNVKNSRFIFGFSISPNIGLVTFTVTDRSTIDLTEYTIEK